MKPSEHRDLERVVANSAHPFFAAPGEAEGEQQRGWHRNEWLSQAQREALAYRAVHPRILRIGLPAREEHGNG